MFRVFCLLTTPIRHIYLVLLSGHFLHKIVLRSAERLTLLAKPITFSLRLASFVPKHIPRVRLGGFNYSIRIPSFTFYLFTFLRAFGFAESHSVTHICLVLTTRLRYMFLIQVETFEMFPKRR